MGAVSSGRVMVRCRSRPHSSTSRRLQPLTSLERRAQRAAASGRVNIVAVDKDHALVAADHLLPHVCRSWAGVSPVSLRTHVARGWPPRARSASSTEHVQTDPQMEVGSVCLCKESYQSARKSSTPDIWSCRRRGFPLPIRYRARWAQAGSRAETFQACFQIRSLTQPRVDPHTY